jgi:ribonuclease III
MNAYADLEAKLGYTFRRPEYLRAALTHTSYANETHGPQPDTVTRLAFLGDAVIELAVRAAVMEHLRNEPRGTLSPVVDKAVKNAKLAEIAGADGLDLAPWLKLGGTLGEAGKTNPRVLSDALEAVAGAIYLDALEKDQAIRTIQRLVWPYTAAREAEHP